jgi:hypothetical protein
MSPDDVSTIKPGIVLQGDGGVSAGATILMNKQADEYTDIILCLAPASTHDPFVVWTYNHARGKCLKGEYFDNLQHALFAYEEREW